jgi:hypothetical protein
LASALGRTRPDEDDAQIEEHAGLAAGSDFSADTETERWRHLLAEKAETIVKVRGLERADAEREAFRHVVVEYADATHPNTDPRLCAWCSKPALRTPLLPFGVGERHAWLHQNCHQAWGARRYGEVVRALAGMGIVEPGAADAAQ